MSGFPSLPIKLYFTSGLSGFPNLALPPITTWEQDESTVAI